MKGFGYVPSLYFPDALEVWKSARDKSGPNYKLEQFLAVF